MNMIRKGQVKWLRKDDIAGHAAFVWTPLRPDDGMIAGPPYFLHRNRFHGCNTTGEWLPKDDIAGHAAFVERLFGLKVAAYSREQSVFAVPFQVCNTSAPTLVVDFLRAVAISTLVIALLLTAAGCAGASPNLRLFTHDWMDAYGILNLRVASPIDIPLFTAATT